MPDYRFTYQQLEDACMSQTFGHWEPTQILMSPHTFSQFREWAIGHVKHGNEWIHTYPIRFNGAIIEPSKDVGDGCVVFIGGAHVLKLTEAPDAL